MKTLKIRFGLGYLLLAVLFQLFAGNFPFRFFAFPVNGLLAAVWLVGVWVLYKDYRQAAFTRLLLSPFMTVFTLGSLLAGCLVIGLFPQLSAAEAVAKEEWWARLGCYDFMSSWIFVAILFLLLTHLALVTYRGMLHRRKHRWRFVANHAGLWLALFAGFLGSADLQTLRIPVMKGEPNTRAFALDGTVVYLDYELELLDFRSEYYENGVPRHYEAQVRVGKDTVALQVNHPYAYRWGEDIYLTGYEKKEGQTTYCVLQIVKQPWKYVQLAGILLTLAGGVMMFVGGPVKKKNEDDNVG